MWENKVKSKNINPFLFWCKFLVIIPYSGKKMNFVDMIKKSVRVSVDDYGRIYIPKWVRNKLNLKKNEDLYMIVEQDFFYVYKSVGIEKKIKKNY